MNSQVEQVTQADLQDRYAEMGIHQRAVAMADNCHGDPWELLGYFREKLRQAEWEADHARSGAIVLAKKAASLASQPPVLDEREGATLSPDPVLLGEVREQRLRMFLEILSASCGQADATEYRWNWINAFCEEHEGLNPDTFNTAIDRGLTTSSHDSDTDIGTVYLTQAGRDLLAKLPKLTGEEV